MKFKLPIKTVSEANKTGEHWAVKHVRHKAQQSMIIWGLREVIGVIKLPVIIKLTRIAPRMLDYSDNLPSSFKNIKDYICDLLIPGKKMGRADSDKRIRVEYDQKKGLPKEYAIEIEIIEVKDE